MVRKALRPAVNEMAGRILGGPSEDSAEILEGFWDQLADMSAFEKKQLQNYGELLEKVYVVDHESRSTRHPGRGELPWPVVLLLAGHSRKHVLLGRRPPVIADVGRACVDASNKLKWRFVHYSGDRSRQQQQQQQRQQRQQQHYQQATHHQHEAQPMQQHPHRRIKLRDMPATLPCNSPHLPAELIAFGRDLHRSMTRAARRSILSQKGKHATHSNFRQYHRAALRWISRADVAPVATDKDGGFALLQRQAIKDFVSEKLKPDTYMRVQVTLTPQLPTVEPSIGMSLMFVGRLDGRRTKESFSGLRAPRTLQNMFLVLTTW